MIWSVDTSASRPDPDPIFLDQTDPGFEAMKEFSTAILDGEIFQVLDMPVEEYKIYNWIDYENGR